MRRIGLAGALLIVTACLAAAAFGAPEAPKAGDIVPLNPPKKSQDAPKKIVKIVLKTDDAESMRAFFIRLGYTFLEDFPEEIIAQYRVACASAHPGGAFVGFVKPPIDIMPWPPPYICVHPRPFTLEEAEHFCTMAADHLLRKLVVLENRQEEKTIICGSP